MDIDQLKFLLKQRLRGFDVPDTPWFDSDATTAWFLAKLTASKHYLEYGTGGSTYAAAKLGVNFVAVDSDSYFLRSVRTKIRRDGYARPTGQTFVHADIGLTGRWGRPIGNVSPRRLQQFRCYSDPPPECDSGGTLPDLVLVDGRFRVACALKAVRMLREEREWLIVVDDYTDRPDYGVIADFARLEQHVGRMAVFTAADRTDCDSLERAIQSYEAVPD